MASGLTELLGVSWASRGISRIELTGLLLLFPISCASTLQHCEFGGVVWPHVKPHPSGALKLRRSTAGVSLDVGGWSAEPRDGQICLK